MKYNNGVSPDDFKDYSSGSSYKPIQSKFEYDLYDEEKATQIDDVIRVKKINLPNAGVNWKIMQNNKVIMLIEGVKLTKKEKDFLTTPAGFQLLIKKYKNEIISLSQLKLEIKSALK